MTLTDDDAAVLRQTLIKETVGLAAIALLLWYVGPGQLIIKGLAHRVKSTMAARGDYIDTQAAQFNTEVSRWDHEQAAQQDHRAGRRGGCGCP